MSRTRPLTHDEKRAAEAAFLDRAFNARWSSSARAVYDGILTARGYAADTFGVVGGGKESAGVPDGPVPVLPEAVHRAGSSDDGGEDMEDGEAGADVRYITSRQEAIDAGLLMDVTATAKRVGFRLAVSLTRFLWQQRIMKTLLPDSPERDIRLRDMLLAVRLRLAGMESPSPWIEVPVLFPSTPDNAPSGVFSVYALFHTDPVVAGCLTLIHPKELSLIRHLSRSDSDEE